MTPQYLILTLFVATAVFGSSSVADKPLETVTAPVKGDHNDAAPVKNGTSSNPLDQAKSSELDPPPNTTTTTPPSTTSPTPSPSAPNTTTTTPAPTTTSPATTTTTLKPNSTTTTPAPSTTTTTLKPNTTTTTSTTPPPTTTTVKPNTTTTTSTTPSPTTSTTLKPNTTTTTLAPPTSTPAPKPDRHFDGASFIGGIVLSVGMTCIGLVAWKFYKARYERNYHTLSNLGGSSNI